MSRAIRQPIIAIHMLWAQAADFLTFSAVVPEVQLSEIRVGGLRLAYRHAGKGVPLVLLHGGPGNSREWRRQLDGLSDEFMVVAWDMPGCGGSDDAPPEFHTRDYAECLAGFIRELELERPHLLGLSFGSGLALELYRWHPEIPRSLVLASAYAGWAGSLPPEVAAQRRQRMLQMVELPPQGWAEQWLPTLLSESASAEVREELGSILAEFHPSAQRDLVLHSGFGEHDVRDVLPTIRVPTLLLYGEKDARSPRPVAEELYAQIQGSRLDFVPGAGHMVSMEAAERFNVEVRNFLRSAT
jgi:pimeloyl-ACP methyl ester carboxylesterase